MPLEPPLSPDDIAILWHTTRRPNADRRVQHYCKIIAALDDGHSQRQVAALLRISRNTVARVYRIYAEKGLKAVLDIRRGGRPPLPQSSIVKIRCLRSQEAPRLTIRQIAKEAKVSVGTVARVISSKE
jgi:transposase